MLRKLCLFHNTCCDHPLKQDKRSLVDLRKNEQHVYFSKTIVAMLFPICSTELVAIIFV